MSELSEDPAASLSTAEAIRERCRHLLDRAAAGASPTFGIDRDALERTAERLVELARTARPAETCWELWARATPGLLDRLGERLGGLGAADQAAIGAALSLLAVLLEVAAERDAVAKALQRIPREALLAGLLSELVEAEPGGGDPALRPLGELARAAAGHAPGLVTLLGPLSRLSARALAAELLGPDPDGALAAPALLLRAERLVRPLIPNPTLLLGRPLGDVWRHPAVPAADRTAGLVPFHGLALRLVAALEAPARHAGRAAEGFAGLPPAASRPLLDALAATRIVEIRHRGVLKLVHPPSSDIAVEWRALATALLDELAARLSAAGTGTRRVEPLVTATVLRYASLDPDAAEAPRIEVAQALF